MNTNEISENFFHDKYHLLTSKNKNKFRCNDFVEGLKLGLEFAKWVESEEKFIKKHNGYSVMDIDSETLDLEDMFEYYIDNIIKI